MEKTYWLGRKRQALTMARQATDASARLIHFDMAGRDGVKAVSPATQAIDLHASLPPPIFKVDLDPPRNEDDHG